MAGKKNLLIEIGTEELPPKSLQRLAEAFAAGIAAGLESHKLNHAAVNWYATPRRLAVIVDALAAAQKDHEVMRRGPALAAAFDAGGRPSRAAEGFARSCGVEVAALERLETGKGSWLVYRSREQGRRTADLLPEIIIAALDRLPIPRRMRWGDSEAEFVRPVHWSVVLFGKDAIPCDILDTRAGNVTRGHRFHHPRPLKLRSSAEYLDKLKHKGRVIADFQERRHMIETQVRETAENAGGEALLEPDLLDEVTSLVEWPVAIAGSFDEAFLQLPREVLVATMQDHQKYFPVAGKDGRLLNRFITISNIDSTAPEEIRRGNERVIRPRLTDAAFFWRRDLARPFEAYAEGLQEVVFQQRLGTLADKTDRVRNLSEYIAGKLGEDAGPVTRAAALSKCDLLTEMVGEFPELQGVMGRYYAQQGGEPAEVARAIDEQYLPRHAGSDLPETGAGRILSMADKLDTLTGIFGIGQVPTGDRDPFGLRRAAIGILRILMQFRLPLAPRELLERSHQLYPPGTLAGNHEDGVSNPVKTWQFLVERARNHLKEQGYTAEEVEAVLDLDPRPAEYRDRLEAVRRFSALPEAAGLSEADKRIRNIIRKSDAGDTAGGVQESLMLATEEKNLFTATRDLREKVNAHIRDGEFGEALMATAALHGPVTAFFDHVMVNADDEAQRNNRFALLHEVGELTNRVANISRLAR